MPSQPGGETGKNVGKGVSVKMMGGLKKGRGPPDGSAISSSTRPSRGMRRGREGKRDGDNTSPSPVVGCPGRFPARFLPWCSMGSDVAPRHAQSTDRPKIASKPVRCLFPDPSVCLRPSRVVLRLAARCRSPSR